MVEEDAQPTKVVAELPSFVYKLNNEYPRNNNST